MPLPVMSPLTMPEGTQGGAVQVYQGVSWTDPAGAFYKCVIMDRNLGATKAGMQDNQIDGRRTFSVCFIRGGRKDPFFAAAGRHDEGDEDYLMK